MTTQSRLSRTSPALLLLSLATACGSSSATSGDGAAAPGQQDAGASPGTMDGAGSPTNDGPVGPPPSAHLPVNLATAASFVILAKSGISVVPTAAVTGDLGVS